MIKKKYNSKNNTEICSYNFYIADEKFKENLKFKCLLLIGDEGKRGFFDFIKEFTIPYPHKFTTKLTSISLSVLMIGGSVFYLNYTNPDLSSDFVLTRVYAENAQTNLMPFMMLSSGFNSYRETAGGSEALNPSFIPLANKGKNYTYGHVGYEVSKGEALKGCPTLYPFSEDLTRVEAYEYISEEGNAHYKIFAMGKTGEIKDFTMLADGQLVKVDKDGSSTKIPLNVISKELNVADIIGQLPKTISVKKQGWDYLTLSWEKKVMCDSSQDNMLIQILVDRNTFKIKNITTHLNNGTPENMVYSIDFVSNTKQYKYEQVKSNFEYEPVAEKLY
jgi:hypothetical protein